MRECGDCEVCCTVMGIDVLNKPPKVACSLLNRIVTLGENGQPLGLTGCSIYNTKPDCCTEFKCLWLHGAIGQGEQAETLRPDRCGVMFDYLRANETITKVSNIIIAYEVVPGAFNKEEMWLNINRMSSRMPVVLNYFDGKKSIIGNKELLDKIIVVKDGQIMIH